MNTISHDRNPGATACNAVFASLRTTLAREVSGSAMLGELLEKLNRMQEACGRPEDFALRFEEFVARAVDYREVVRPFFPELVRFLPIYQEHQISAEPRVSELHIDSDLAWEVA
jgi:hypothetical protein